jgi:hypothetical protein
MQAPRQNFVLVCDKTCEKTVMAKATLHTLLFGIYYKALVQKPARYPSFIGASQISHG